MPPELHVITDSRLAGGLLVEVVEAALAAGADVIQYREKEGNADTRRAMAAQLAQLVAAHSGARFVVNDDCELAKESNAAGVHVGPRDTAVEQVRAEWPMLRIVGASCREVPRARELERAGANYLGVGPVFFTATKRDLPEPVGLDRIHEIAEAVTIPVIGIGGIHAENAASVIEAGAQGVAVISSVMGAEDPQRATRDLVEVLRGAGLRG